MDHSVLLCTQALGVILRAITYLRCVFEEIFQEHLVPRDSLQIT